MRRYTWASFLIITIAMIVANVFYAQSVSSLDSEFAVANDKLNDRKELSLRATNAKGPHSRLTRETQGYQRFIVEGLNHKDNSEVTPSRLLSKNITTIAIPQNETRSHKIKVLTDETDKIELVYDISHRSYKTMQEMSSGFNTGTELNKYSYIIPIKAKAWNVISMDFQRNLDGVRVSSKVNDQTSTICELPFEGTATTGSFKYDFFVGVASPDEQGICFESLRDHFVLMSSQRSLTPNEALVVNWKIRNRR